MRLDPAARSILFRVAHARRLKGEYQGALDALGQILEMDSTDYPVHYEMGVIFHLIGDTAQARGQLEEFLGSLQVPETDSHQFYNHISSALALARVGEEGRSLEFARAAMEIDSTSSAAHFDLARWSAVLGQNDSAINHLNRAVQEGFRNFIWMKIHPDLISLCDDPRFKAIIQKGLHPES